MDWSRILDALKLGTGPLVAILLATSAVLFGPPVFLERLGVPEDLGGYRLHVGLAWLGVAAVLVVRLPTCVVPRIQRKWLQRRLMKYRKQRLHELTPEEQAVLAFYLANNTRTQSLSFTDGVTRELEAHDIIGRASQVSQMYMTFPYNIQPWAWKYLHEHPELLVQAREGMVVRSQRHRRLSGVLGT